MMMRLVMVVVMMMDCRGTCHCTCDTLAVQLEWVQYRCVEMLMVAMIVFATPTL
jgi:hypothetical protein